jgi:glycosyltransferase involved in cell wall biosynthesis
MADDSMEAKQGRLKVLALTSTFPRWESDVEPGFVFELYRRMVHWYDIRVLAPHYIGAALEEEMDGVRISRFRYWIPRWQTLTYAGGILNRIRQNRWRVLLLPLFTISLAWTTHRMIRRYGIQLLHVHWIIPQGLASIIACAGISKRPQILCTSHGGDWYSGRGSSMRLLKLKILERMDCVAVVSTAMRESMISVGVDAAKIRVLPMGVDLKNRFVPQKGLARQRDLLLFVGRLVEKKGVRHLIDALVLLRQTRPGLQLVIAGWGPDETNLRRQVQQLDVAGHVQFIGAVPQQELPKWYSRATLAVFPFVESRDGDQEGLGLVLVEALGCQCPVVASNLPAIRDVITPGETGELVESGNSTALAERIGYLLDSPEVAAEMARRGRVFVADRFDWVAVSYRYAKAVSDSALLSIG